MSNVRAKFVCRSVLTDTAGATITLAPVSDGSEENKRFFKYTPCGEIKMGTINPEAAAQFVPGKSYYVDFTVAE